MISRDFDFIRALPKSAEPLTEEEKYVMNTCFPPQFKESTALSRVGKAAKVSVVDSLIFVVLNLCFPEFKSHIHKTLAVAGATVAIATVINYFIFFHI